MVNWRKIFSTSSDQPSSDPDSFRDFALATLRERFHGASFQPAPESLVITFGDHRFGLQSAMSIFLRDNLSGEETREMIAAHFERMLADIAEGDNPAPPPWSEAKRMLRPQIMPIEYIEQAPASLLHWDLNEDTAIGVVLDRENTYSYVREEDPPLWGKTPDEVREQAVENLNENSAGIEMYSSDGPEQFVGIQVADGYDAARILIPGLRNLLETQLGRPFFVGIPNRDFLICWSSSCSAAFHEFTRQKLAKDFEAQPYPLTPAVFVATADSVTPEAGA